MLVLLVRSAQVLALLVAAALAVLGALALRGPGLVTVLVAAVVVGAVSAGMASETPAAARGRALDTGGRAAGWTAGVLLVLAGLAAVAGAVVTVLVAGTVATAVLTIHVRRAGARSRAAVRPSLPGRYRPRRRDRSGWRGRGPRSAGSAPGLSGRSGCARRPCWRPTSIPRCAGRWSTAGSRSSTSWSGGTAPVSPAGWPRDRR